MRNLTILKNAIPTGVILMMFIADLWSNPVSCEAQSADDDVFAALQADARMVLQEHVTPFVMTYCRDCHGNRVSEAGLNFEPALKHAGDPAFVKRWKQAFAHVKAHDMPPNDAEKQPSEEERQRFMEWLQKVKYLSPKDPGAFVIRRLTKVEYGNTLHDLFGVDSSIARELPDDVSGEGYLNSFSPLQLEQYLAIANEVLELISKPENVPSTEMQRLLLGESPPLEADERMAAKEIARSMARMAYRRPPSNAELEVLLAVFDLGRQDQLTYQSALRLMLKAVLVSPQFLFITPAGEYESSQSIVPLDHYQLASRLSYLLWATMPDRELMALADNGKLHEPEVLRAQVKRLLEDPRARALFDGFGAQWLGVGSLQTKTFDNEKFPQMTSEMRSAMYDEARLFFDSIVRENRSVVSFVDSDYTFLNETLAPIYGLEATVTGSEMLRVHLANTNRGGVLGMPGILASTSLPNRTSPVKRGVWVLEQVLGERVPPPPPNVPELEKQDKSQIANLTLRQRTELHRTDAVCANCHNLLDPIGFGLENFDAIGRWRDQDDTGGAIDASGELPGGKHFASPAELKQIIAGRTDALARNLAEKLLAYALCRQLEGYDEIVVDGLMQKIACDGYRMQSLVTEIITSYPFTHRRIQEQGERVK